jgi:hypothetical protein
MIFVNIKYTQKQLLPDTFEQSGRILKLTGHDFKSLEFNI